MSIDLVSDIYSATIINLLSGIEPSEAEEITKLYQEYLQERYGRFEIYLKNYENVSNTYISNENERWLGMSSDEKKSYLYTDKNLEKLGELSGKAEEYARKRIQNDSKISVCKAKSLLKQMERHYKKVLSFNKELAMQYLSEGSVDCLYASNQSNYSSIRLSVERMIHK